MLRAAIKPRGVAAFEMQFGEWATKCLPPREASNQRQNVGEELEEEAFPVEVEVGLLLHSSPN